LTNSKAFWRDIGQRTEDPTFHRDFWDIDHARNIIGYQSLDNAENFRGKANI